MNQEIKTVFCYNGTEYSFDVSDAEDAARFENALDVLGKREKEMPKTGKASELVRFQSDMIKEFFDACLGTGAGNAICTERSNVSMCYAAYVAFIDLIRQQKDNIVDMGNTSLKYSSERLQRREREMRGSKNHRYGSRL